ncbi:MAG: LysR family transcriptional regulator [Aliishimia sp.]
MRQMNLNALRVFSVVASNGTLQSAANELGLSRGAVSQRIKQLEIDLGVVLLTRGVRGVSPTSEGKRLHKAIDAALAIMEMALVGIEDTRNRITLHLGSSTAAKWLMPRVDDFADRFPNLSLTTEVHQDILPRSLGRNEIANWPVRNPTKTQPIIVLFLRTFECSRCAVRILGDQIGPWDWKPC